MKKRNYLPEAPCICISLRRISHKVTDFYDKALKSTGVSINQYSLLINISRMEGCGTGELAQRVRLEKCTLVRTLQPLLRDGLIADKSSGTARRRRLHLTPAGEDVLKKALPLWDKAQEDVAVKLGKSYEELMRIFNEVDLWE
ncbi:MAG: MarR family winged helix-turn-helix transcriptional regulator [Deltaproteobacteria bacterium]|jgi:DNA-binding MarR family transcriptional regulator|nr:MarR family winged helix-turn-helix transcriptional regulator [Deltaproteobacteria bacterium]